MLLMHRICIKMVKYHKMSK